MKETKKWILYAIIAVMSTGALRAMQEETMRLEDLFKTIDEKLNAKLDWDEAYTLLWRFLRDKNTDLIEGEDVATLLDLGKTIIEKTDLILARPRSSNAKQIRNAIVGNAILLSLVLTPEPMEEEMDLEKKTKDRINSLIKLLPENYVSKFQSKRIQFARNIHYWISALNLMRTSNARPRQIENVIIGLLFLDERSSRDNELILQLISRLPQEKRATLADRLLKHLLAETVVSGGAGAGPGVIPLPSGGNGGQEALRKASGLPPLQPTSWKIADWLKFLAGSASGIGVKTIYDYWQKSKPERKRETLV